MTKRNKRGEQLSIKKIREIIRHHFKLKLSNEKISYCVGVSKGSVNNTLKRFRASNLDFSEALELKDSELKAQIYPKIGLDIQLGSSYPDFGHIKKELSKPHVTKQILYEEYSSEFPDGLARTAFYEHLKKYLSVQKISMHIEHIGGERLYLDYSGDRLPYFDKVSRTVKYAEIFVASWGASSYCYFEPSKSQKKNDWVSSNVRALNYFGGSPTYLVPDNLKSAVIKANYYDPEINSTYQKMAEHYETTILPARSRKPKDKAVVEANVRAIQQRVFSKLRNETFNSFEELWDKCMELLEEFNAHDMQQYKRSRSLRFDELDKPYLSKLPLTDYVYTDIQLSVKVREDHHVFYNKHYYSVPWKFTGSIVEVWKTENIIEIYEDSERIAVHQIGEKHLGYTTIDGHRPPGHLYIKKLKPCYVLSEASNIGPETLKAFRNIFRNSNRNSEVAIRKCMGILRLEKEYGKERLEKAISRSLLLAKIKEPEIKNILIQGLEDSPLWEQQITETNIVEEKITNHENLRGAKNYT